MVKKKMGSRDRRGARRKESDMEKGEGREVRVSGGGPIILFNGSPKYPHTVADLAQSRISTGTTFLVISCDYQKKHLLIVYIYLYNPN